jgi:dihydrofolate reductase
MRACPKPRNYVVSRTLAQKDFPEVTMLGDTAVDASAALRLATGKDIWLCGGGALSRRPPAARLVDTVELGVSAMLLRRSGVPMIACAPPRADPVRLELTRQQSFPSGLLVLEYGVSDRAVERSVHLPSDPW